MVELLLSINAIKGEFKLRQHNKPQVNQTFFISVNSTVTVEKRKLNMKCYKVICLYEKCYGKQYHDKG